MDEEYFNTIIDNIHKIRRAKKVTKEDAAKALNVSRATYINIEKKNSKRDITLRELNILAHYLDVDVRNFISSNENKEKFVQMYFYALSFFKHGVPKTKLAKILYLADFKYYFDNRRSISGVSYIHRQYGPLADGFLELTDELYDAGKIKIRSLDQGAFLISSLVFHPADDLLSFDEKKTIAMVCRAWLRNPTKEIVNYTHEQKPWAETKDGERIPYEAILRENAEHVYRPVGSVV